MPTKIKMSKKTKVLILYGGRSVEHEISIRSAKNVTEHIDRERYEVYLIGIDKKGPWFFHENMNADIADGEAVFLNLSAAGPFFVRQNGTKIIPDVVFPVLHGTGGEDGSVQGLFTAMGVPVVGSGVLGSAVAMDKIVSKKVLLESGIPVAPFMEFDKSQREKIDFHEITQKLGLPFMIKSAALGSSVGVSKVKSEDDFKTALEESFRYDKRVIIEQFVAGRELECAVIGNDTPKASFPGEIIMVKDYDFYTYTAKYLDEDAIKIQLPAALDEGTTEKIRQISIDAYKTLRCEDYARVDLFLTESGRVIVNEINTIPGFTNVSMFPMMWQHMGLTYTELITKLINLCLSRYDSAKDTETDYKAVN